MIIDMRPAWRTVLRRAWHLPALFAFCAWGAVAAVAADDGLALMGWATAAVLCVTVWVSEITTTYARRRADANELARRDAERARSYARDEATFYQLGMREMQERLSAREGRRL